MPTPQSGRARWDRAWPWRFVKPGSWLALVPPRGSASRARWAGRKTHKQHLGIAPGALIDRRVGWRQCEARRLALLDHHKGARCQPTAPGERQQRALGEPLAVGRVDKGETGAAVSARGTQIRGVAAEDFADAGQSQRLHVAPNGGARRRRLFDEEAVGSAAR